MSAARPTNGRESSCTSRPSPISNGVYFCDSMSAFLLLLKSTSISSRPASTRATSSASMPAAMDVERAAALHQRVPDGDRAVPRHPDLVAEIAGVAGARDLDRHAGDRPARHAEIFQAADVGVGHRVEQAAGRRPLQRERGHLLRDVLDVDVQADGVLREPAQAGIGRGPAERVLGQPRHRSVVDHLAVLVAPRRVVDLADGELRRVARDDAIDQRLGVGPVTR